jgi:hypothetical protein
MSDRSILALSCLAILCLFALFALFAVQPSSSSHHESRQHSSQSEEEAEPLEGGAQQLSSWRSVVRDYEKEAVVFTGLFTVILALATIALFLATRGLVKEAEDTSERQLRAYVGISNNEVINYTPDGLNPRIVLQVKNFGQTPATNLQYWANASFERHPNRPFRPEKIVLWPGDVFTPTIPMSPSAEDVEALKNERKMLHVYGKIEYTDAFRKQRRTTFHLIYTGKLLDFGHLAIASDGNDAD